MHSLAEYEAMRELDWERRYVQGKRIFETIAFALHYLGDVRTTFGSHGIEWQFGLAKEMSRLREERDEVLVLDCVQPALLICQKLFDLATFDAIKDLFSVCKILARHVYDRHIEEGLPLKGRACGDLFKAFNNIACLLLQDSQQEEAEQWVKDATALVRDDEDDADVFLCNSASLISAASDNIKEVGDLLLRAESVASGALSEHAQALLVLHEEIQLRHTKLQEMDNSFLEGLPPLGEEFLVRVEADQVKKIASIVPQLQAEIARLGAQVVEEQAKLEKAKIRVMRVYRKLTNFYARKVTRPPGPAKATKYGKMLMNTIQNCPDIPLKDMISNATTIANYYLRWCADEQRVAQRKHYAKQGM
jgi:hypothetical protein